MEERILQLAVVRGLLTLEQVESLQSGSKHSNDAGEVRLDQLIILGMLSRDVVEELRRELQETHAPASGGQRIVPDPFVNSEFGQYQVHELLGQGGMARVYRAYDRKLGRVVALKLLRIEDPELIQRLLTEARSQARVSHENVCEVYETGEVGGKQYIALQYIPGKTLKAAMPGMELMEKVRLMKLVADAVHAAHRVGIIHRDLKPANILVERSEDGPWIPYVMDFGLAREVAAPGPTVSGHVLGTPWYVSPEQARGEVRSLDARTDIYSMGATLYEMLCGRTPHDASSTIEILGKVVHEDPLPLRQRNPQVSPDLETIVMKCLEKEPERRYETARALSEDLQRFQEGEPIFASRTTWTYRAARKIRKYPRFAWWMGVAVFLILALAALGIRTWWMAGQRLKFANEFSQEVRYMQETLRNAYTEPLHDVRPEEALVRNRLDRIRSRIENAGTAALGPGAYAIGRGEMALHRYEQARVSLENAWNQQDYRLPEVAYSLGLTLAMLYRKELESIAQIRSEELRATRRKEVDREYRDAALLRLRAGRDAAADSSEYVEALLAFLEKDYTRALQKCDAASRRLPWFYEARTLAGDILVVQANELRDRGEAGPADALYQKAESAYREATERGRSDSEAYTGLCAMHGEWMSLHLYQTGGSLQGSYDKAVVACQTALKAQPQSARAREWLAALNWRWGEFRMQKGDDPRPNLESSASEAREALRLNPASLRACMVMASSYGTMAQYEMSRGADPVPSLERAIQATREAIRINPNDPSPYNGSGICYFFRSIYERRTGKDPRPSLEEAIVSYRKALDISPRFANGYSNMGLAQWNRATYEMERGIDPRPTLKTSASSFQKAIEINASDFVHHGNRALVFSTLADYEMDNGLDPSASLEASIQAYRKSLENHPGYSQYLNDLCVSIRRKAEWLRNKGSDFEPVLKEAENVCRDAIRNNPENGLAYLSLSDVYLDMALFRAPGGSSDAVAKLKLAKEALDRAGKINPKDADVFIARGNMELAGSRVAESSQQSPWLLLETAEQNFQEALLRNSTSIEALLGVAKCRRWKAEWRINRKQPAGDDVEAGLTMVARVLSIAPRSAKTFTLRGTLLLCRARISGQPSDALEAEKSLQEALRINTNLQRELDPLLQQARKLAQR